MTTTLRLFGENQLRIEPRTAWYLNDLGEFRGRQALYTQQAPQRLKVLRESAIIESAVSSNRLEGVTADPSRVRDILVSPRPLFRDRDEEEIRGYRDALSLIHENANSLPLSNETIRRFHALTRGEIMDELIADWERCREERWIPPPIALAAFNLDFLCIHPFRDGNGRVSRLLWLLQSYQLGYEVGRYISLERLVEENKDRYYETLEMSSEGWHDGKHNPWPYINFVLSIMILAYRGFVARVGEVKAPRGEKRETVLKGINLLMKGPKSVFTLRELEQVCPGVSRDMVRHVLREQQESGAVVCHGRGPGAVWKRPEDLNGGNESPSSKGNNKGNNESEQDPSTTFPAIRKP